MVLPENISRALDMLESAGHEAWVSEAASVTA